MFKGIISAVVFFLAAVLGAYAAHAAPGGGFGSNSGSMPEFIWGAISLICLVGGILCPIMFVCEEVDQKSKR